MRKEYDFSQMTPMPNPFAAARTSEVSLAIGADVVAHFARLSAQTGIEPEKLMALFLRQCALHRLGPTFALPSAPTPRPRPKRAAGSERPGRTRPSGD